MEFERLLLPEDKQELDQHGGLDLAAPKAAEILGYSSKGSLREESSRPSIARPASYSTVTRAWDNSDSPLSFSEDDLVPTKPQWAQISKDNTYKDSDQERDSSIPASHVYSKPPESANDSRISVQRAMFVSHSPTRRSSHASQDTEPPAQNPPSQRHTDTPRKLTPSISDSSTTSRSRSLSKTFSLRKSRTSRSTNRSPDRTSKMDETDSSSQQYTSTESRENESQSSENATTNSANEEKSAISSTGFTPRRIMSLRSKKSSSQTNKSNDSSDLLTSKPPKRSMTPIFKSLSSNNVPSLADSNANVPPVPGPVPVEKFAIFSDRSSRRKDDLWTAFRSLESDLTKFHSKSISLKTNVIRGSLLTFLNRNTNPTASARIRPEDLDRRCSILNKWWIALLDLLMGKEYDSISGTDRPTILQAVAGIMQRKEWRYPPSIFAPLSERVTEYKSAERTNTSKSLDPESEDFLVESVHHNIRNIFIQNLSAQMEFVVNKMSQKHSPASLTSFCGKACAYGFFFCPGIAEVLVREWKVSFTSMRRVITAAGLDATVQLSDQANTINASFPPCLHPFTFQSLQQASMYLKTSPVLPFGINRLQFQGQWRSRWSGRDSELFYTFVRHFHKLTLDFLPAQASVSERLCSPAMVIIRTQMLTNLDSIIQRSSSHAKQDKETEVRVTFDDILNVENASSGPPTNPLNTVRHISENRLVMMLKEISRQDSKAPSSSSLFMAESYHQITKAATSSTSVYDQVACVNLCDFLQEALASFLELKSKARLTFQSMDWQFWIDVFKRLVSSYNTTVEMRLYALLFTIWPSLNKHEVWKEKLCQQFLLSDVHFARTFNHWSPMVRAYFMRLVCWRLSRYDGEASAKNADLLKAVVSRLRETWLCYKLLDEQAQQKNILRPSTAPCPPAPGREMLIIRQDNQVSAPLISFNSFVPAAEDSNTLEDPDSSISSENPPNTLLDKVTASFESIDLSRKSGNLLKSIFGSRTGESRAGSQSPKTSPKSSPKGSRSTSPEKSNQRSSLYEHRPNQQSSSPRPPRPRPQTHHPVLSARRHGGGGQAEFKFSLEACNREMGVLRPDMELSQPRLPLAAQVFVEGMPDYDEQPETSKLPKELKMSAAYTGRALAEWTMVQNECQNFFERRRIEGVITNRLVETPVLTADFIPRT